MAIFIELILQHFGQICIEHSPLESSNKKRSITESMALLKHLRTTPNLASHPCLVSSFAKRDVFDGNIFGMEASEKKIIILFVSIRNLTEKNCFLVRSLNTKHLKSTRFIAEFHGQGKNNRFDSFLNIN